MRYRNSGLSEANNGNVAGEGVAPGWCLGVVQLPVRALGPHRATREPRGATPRSPLAWPFSRSHPVARYLDRSGLRKHI